MKRSNLSLVTLLALGSFSMIHAKTPLNEMIEGASVNGYAYLRYTNLFGNDGAGSSVRARTFFDLSTGATHGFQLTSKVYASIGTTTPDNNYGILEQSPYNLLDLGLWNFYATQGFESTTTSINVGKLTIDTPFSDGDWDASYGITVSNSDVEGFTFYAQAHAAWELDNASTKYKNADNVSVGSVLETESTRLKSRYPLFLVGMHGGGTEEFKGVSFDLWAGYANKVIDYITYANVAYTLDGLTLSGKVAATQVDTSFYAFNKNGLSAKLRGLYNLEAQYNFQEQGIALKAGYTGSFGDGYGAVFNSWMWNLGGNIWYNTLPNGDNGAGMLGVGGRKYQDSSGKAHATTLQVGYVGFSFSKDKFGVGVDYAYVGGDNNYRPLPNTYIRKYTTDGTLAKNQGMNVKLHDLSLSLSYAISESVSYSMLVGSTFGDLQIGRAYAQVFYKF